MLQFHRAKLQKGLPMPSPLIKRALQGVAQSHVAEYAARLRGTYCWKDRAWLRRGARAAEFFGCLSRWTFYFAARSDKVFASWNGVVHLLHFLTRRDVALYRGGARLTLLQWRQTSIEVRF